VSRHAVLVQVANLSACEKTLLDTVIAILTDPALARARSDLMEGRMALAMEAGEVTWVDGPEVVEAA
jgi:hypothetical protein